MIAGHFHEGSGLGNQLFRYVTVRTLAEDKGYKWQMMGEFKGKDFMPLYYEQAGGIYDWGKLWNEKKVVENGIDIRSYDPEINFVQDDTIIDGEFQDARYWEHKLPQIDNWLAVEPLEVPDDVCVVGFRGGEYYSDPNLGLPTNYFEQGIMEMHKINPKMIFEVHTDDPRLAELLLTPIFGTNPSKITYVGNERLSHSNHSNMGYNWRAMRYAKHAIIANSSFYILPRLLSRGVTVAPRYWARRNVKVWALPQNYYSAFTYL